MITATSVLMGLILSWALKAANPVKTSLSILFSSFFMFFTMALYTGQTWIPILLLMLFMGGIIMMFMILSSILPNEKSMKMKNILMFSAVILVSTLFRDQCFPMEKMGAEMKSFIVSGMTFYFMMSIILAYFIISLSILSMEEAPMRSILCFKKI